MPSDVYREFEWRGMVHEASEGADQTLRKKKVHPPAFQRLRDQLDQRLIVQELVDAPRGRGSQPVAVGEDDFPHTAFTLTTAYHPGASPTMGARMRGPQLCPVPLGQLARHREEPLPRRHRHARPHRLAQRLRHVEGHRLPPVAGLSDLQVRPVLRAPVVAPWGQKALERAQECSWERTARKTNEVYRGALEARRTEQAR